MADQTTDEAAVDNRHRAFVWSHALTHEEVLHVTSLLFEIEDFRAQLTAATRRAEQAERMLAEAVPYMVHTQGCASQSYDAANKHRRGACDCKYNEFLAAIRSAASGEQG